MGLMYPDEILYAILRDIGYPHWAARLCADLAETKLSFSKNWRRCPPT